MLLFFFWKCANGAMVTIVAKWSQITVVKISVFRLNFFNLQNRYKDLLIFYNFQKIQNRIVSHIYIQNYNSWWILNIFYPFFSWVFKTCLKHTRDFLSRHGGRGRGDDFQISLAEITYNLEANFENVEERLVRPIF